MKIRPEKTSGEFFENLWFYMKYIEKSLSVPNTYGQRLYFSHVPTNNEFYLEWYLSFIMKI